MLHNPPPTIARICVVSGLPRSGTSLMMALLGAGGMPLLVDDARLPDQFNPKGYYEFGRTLSMSDDASWLAQAAGKAVKIVSTLLFALPHGGPYDIVFMDRDLAEVVASQQAMMKDRGEVRACSAQKLRRIFVKHLMEVAAFLSIRRDIRVLHVNYNLLVHDARPWVQQLCDFLGRPLCIDRMVTTVDPALYQNRASQAEGVIPWG